MKRLVVVALFALMASGCETMQSARYAVSIDNNQALKQYAGAAVRMSITTTAPFDANCRLAGPIQAADGVTLPQFVEKAFNDEFKFANIYSDSGVTLHGSLTKLAFSSSEGLTNGRWDLGITLAGNGGKTMSADTSYRFPSGFEAITACNHTAQALGSAVQDLIKKVVTDPQFGALIK
jgi:hypothetical protein